MLKIARYLLLALLAWSSCAWGHAALISTTPAAGAVLDTAPAMITLHFSEPVGVTVLRLFDPSGHATVLKPSRDTDSQVQIRIPKNAAHGSYLLSWRIVSADGHPVGGTLDYAVGAPSTLNAAAADPDGAVRDGLIWLTRWLGYLCLFAACGAALFRTINPADHQPWARPFIGFGLVLLPVELVLQGLDLLGAPWSGVIQRATWSQALASSYALTLGLIALTLLCAAAALGARRTGRIRFWAGISLLLAGAALAASGHASTAPVPWIPRPVVALHVMMAIAWIGSLIPLARALKGHAVPPPAGLPAVRDLHETRARGPALGALSGFSLGIVPIVILLVLAGLTLVWLQLDQISDFWRTAYGRVLMAKLALVALLFCLAAWNRWHLTGPVRAGSSRARDQLRRAISLEVVLAVLILAVVSLWRFTPPPRNLDQAQAAAQSILPPTTLADDRVKATIQTGPRHWTILLTQAGGKPFAAQGLSLTLSNPIRGIEAITRPAKAQGDGRWRLELPALPPGGDWQIRLEILIDDFDQITLDNAPPAGVSPEPMHRHAGHS